VFTKFIIRFHSFTSAKNVHFLIFGADLIELLLKKEEDLILSKMSMMSEPLDKYLNI